MPNNKNERKGKQTGELSAEERFRNFFSTSVIDLPEEMTHRDEPAPVEEKPKAGLLGKLFGHDKEETPAAAQPVLEIPTGEILLGADARPVQPEQEDMALELRTADPVPVMPLQFARTEPVKAVPAEPVPAPKAAAAVQQATEKPVPQPKPQPAAAPQKQPKAKNAPEILLPQEELEQREMQQLKDMLNGMSGKAKPAPQPAKPVQAEPQPKVQPAPAQPAAEPEKAPAKAAQKAAEELPSAVFASVPADPETLPKKSEKKSIFQMFGTAEDEKPAARKPEKEDTMSLPLLPLEQDGAPAEPAPAPADAAPAAPAQPETAPEAAVPTEEAVPESTTDKLHHMAAELTLRCVLAGILAVVLLHLGLTAERLLPPLSVLDPDAAPAGIVDVLNGLGVKDQLAAGGKIRGQQGLQCRHHARAGRCGSAAAGSGGHAECQRLPQHRGHRSADRYGGAGTVSGAGGQPGDAVCRAGRLRAGGRGRRTAGRLPHPR